ncbi:hypothetical protein LWI29_027255 [Acer saccharum]|uniref:Uncharacterized protein n=1 Tax=Acer saccharum TaxID=4024 RepID=A0AA39RNB6_ACESA|nr:hypothetical protein LWI29_027255 [Acer saccharum]
MRGKWEIDDGDWDWVWVWVVGFDYLRVRVCHSTQPSNSADHPTQQQKTTARSKIGGSVKRRQRQRRRRRRRRQTCSVIVAAHPLPPSPSPSPSPSSSAAGLDGQLGLNLLNVDC